jgi:Domain of unknown function (DUF4139)
MGTSSRRAGFALGLLVALSGASLGVVGCKRSRVDSGPALRLARVVVYRNGVGYFERRGQVSESRVTFRVLQRDVNDFLATLVVMERGGSSVRAAAFPMPEDGPDGAAPKPDARRTVAVALDGNEHDLVVGYAVETPIWRPSYRLVYSREGVRVQAWGIVQNLSGEDWTDVRLSLVTGAPVSFRTELARAVVPLRPMVSDEGAVIQAVPGSETTLAHEEPTERPAAAATRTPHRAPGGVFAALARGDVDGNGNLTGDEIGDAFGYGGLGATGTGWGGGGTGEGTIGLGNIGTIGHGAGTGSGQGYGSGAGAGLRGRGATGPLVRALPLTMSGLLSPEAVRRVVLRNLGQVTHCHEQGLAMNPSASGRISVNFVIGGAGAVVASTVGDVSYPVASVGQCIANAVARWQFPSPEGGGLATVNYPFMLLDTSGGSPPTGESPPVLPQRPAPTTAPRNAASLAAIASQGGSTRYDVANAVTVPDHSATMVMLTSRDVPGEQMFLFAPDPGVPESATHPFHVARFVNRTGATLERGPLAIFEDGAFLGQGMLDALPDGATSTVPFSLQRAVTVERRESTAVEGARLVSMHHGTLTVERYNVRRATFHVRNGSSDALRVMVREPLDGGATLHQPPVGTETSNGAALAPCPVNARGEADVLVTTRAPFSVAVDLADDVAHVAVEQYLREGNPTAEVATSLRAALELQRNFVTVTAERADVERRRNDLERASSETRANLDSLQGNGRASDLRAQLTARLGRTATEVDQLTRRIVELDVQLGEVRVRLSESVRVLELDVTPNAPAATR